MINDYFEWDDEKATLNMRKHGVSFEEAASVFDDPYLQTSEDVRDYEESRYISIGMSSAVRLLRVIWTIRGNRIRLISAWRLKT